MKAKKYWILAITSLSILVALGTAYQRAVKAEKPIEHHKAGGEATTGAKEQFGIDESRESDDEFLEKLYGIQIALEPADTLKGLQGVCVLVSTTTTTKEAEKYGLTKQVIQTDTELRLRQNGIRVLTREELGERFHAFYLTGLKRMDAALLHVIVNPVIAEDMGVAAVAIDLRVMQTAFLPRERDILYRGAVTWQSGSVRLVGLGMLKEVRERVKDVVDEFLNEYLAANPKERAKKKAPTLDELLEKAKPKDEQKQ